MDELDDADVKELAIHRRVSRLNYSHRCAEASAVQAHLKQGIPLAPGMEIGYVIGDARKWEVDPERTASKFDAVYYRVLLEKAWGRLRLFLHIWRFLKVQGLESGHKMSPSHSLEVLPDAPHSTFGNRLCF